MIRTAAYAILLTFAVAPVELAHATDKPDLGQNGPVQSGPAQEGPVLHWIPDTPGNLGNSGRPANQVAPISPVNPVSNSGNFSNAGNLDCPDCPKPRSHYDTQEVVHTTKDVDQSRVINTTSVVPVAPRTKETNHLVIQKNTIRNVGVVQHNHTIIEKEIRYKRPVHRPKVVGYIVQDYQTVYKPAVVYVPYTYTVQYAVPYHYPKQYYYQQSCCQQPQPYYQQPNYYRTGLLQWREY